jgi:hypothetical protein
LWINIWKNPDPTGSGFPTLLSRIILRGFGSKAKQAKMINCALIAIHML